MYVPHENPLIEGTLEIRELWKTHRKPMGFPHRKPTEDPWKTHGKMMRKSAEVDQLPGLSLVPDSHGAPGRHDTYDTVLMMVLDICSN